MEHVCTKACILTRALLKSNRSSDVMHVLIVKSSELEGSAAVLFIAPVEEQQQSALAAPRLPPDFFPTACRA